MSDSITNNIAIGIDLGTYYSCVAVHINNKTITIPNPDGYFTTPSYVAFSQDNSDILVGLSAKSQIIKNPYNTIYDSKRLIGRKFSDKIISQDMKLWPFCVANLKTKNNNQEEIIIQVDHNNTKINLTAEKVSSYILKYLKKYAEDYMNCTIKYAVITIPAYFNDAQRQATKIAAEIAGLEVLKLIHEPTSAAIAYGLGQQDEKIILVVDIGAGTTDITLMILDGDLYQVKATCGDTHLGGQDLDNKLVVYALKEFAKKNKNININNILTNKKQINKLKNACEEAKCILSSLLTSNILVEAFCEDIDLNIDLSRSVFENICQEEFNKIKQLIINILQDAGIIFSNISEIILVGGGSKIIYIQNLIKSLFNKEHKKGVDPDQAIACGAAIYAAQLIESRNKISSNTNLVLVDVAPLSLGVESAGGVMTKIIKRNTTVPCTKEFVFSTFNDNQRIVIIKVFEGEREFTKYNNLLGVFELIGVPAMKKGEPKIIVTFMLDTNGILKITAVEDVSKLEISVVLTNKSLNKDIVDKNIEREITKDKLILNIIDSKNKLLGCINNIKESISQEDIKVRLGEDKIKEINTKIIEINSLVINKEMSCEEYEEKYKEVISWMGWGEIAVRE